MTIAAGVLCPDGVIIAADTQYTGQYHKVNATKVFGQEYGFGAVLFGLAGNEGLAQSAIEKCRSDIGAKSGSVKSHATVRDIIEAVMVKHYRTHVYSIPQYKTVPWDYDFQLIIGIYVSGERPSLYQSYHTTMVQVVQATTGIAAMGTGEHLFNFLIKSKTFSPIRSMDEMLLLITSAISRCIDYVPNVGGNVEVAAITLDGKLTQAKRHHVALLRKYAIAFEEQAATLLRHAESPEIDDQEFDALLGAFLGEVRAIRKRWILDDLVVEMRNGLTT
jgi:20S proteasome alpha/beta subunit